MGEAPITAESKYAPLNLEEFQNIKRDLAGITHTLPTHLAGIFWQRCNAIRGVNTPQPCTCSSAARHWGSCVSELQAWVKSKEENQ